MNCGVPHWPISFVCEIGRLNNWEACYPSSRAGRCRAIVRTTDDDWIQILFQYDEFVIAELPGWRLPSSQKRQSGFTGRQSDWDRWIFASHSHFSCRRWFDIVEKAYRHYEGRQFVDAFYAYSACSPAPNNAVTITTIDRKRRGLVLLGNAFIIKKAVMDNLLRLERRFEFNQTF